MRALLRASSLWVAGREILRGQPHERRPEDAGVRPELRVEGLLGSERIPRADRVTQLGAWVLARSLEGLEAVEPEACSVLTASVFATAHTNERFERRFLEGKPPEPRVFPFTAPNAAAGELSIAVRARGPTLCLVGGAEVGVAALATALRWLALGRCQRALVVATECLPQQPELVAPAGASAVECAVALVLEPGNAAPAGATLFEAAWCPADSEEPPSDPWYSVGPLADVLRAASAGTGLVRVVSGPGAGLEVRVFTAS